MRLALVDCNNFFVSCERLFRPELIGKPVVVMSSGDGCAVSRSNEAKQAGITMAAPYFKQRELFERAGVIRCSANFELYGNISKRITQLLQTCAERIEAYSIDESFLDISALPPEEVEPWARALRRQILREIGIPVSIGIGSTKTLAKLANQTAKRQPAHKGVVHITDKNHEALLAAFPLADIWGIGRRNAPKLRAFGLHTALRVSQAPERLMQQLLGVQGRRLGLELRGTTCYPLQLEDTPQHTIMRGRTFGGDTNQASAIESALANMASQAAFQLRRQQGLAHKAGLLIETNRHKPGYRRFWHEVRFTTPTDDTGSIIGKLYQAFAEAHQPGAQYHRLNVFLYDLSGEQQVQTDVFGAVDVAQQAAASKRLKAIDALNRRYGRGHVRYAAELLDDSWQPAKTMQSPRYVTRWSELPIARIVV